MKLQKLKFITFCALKSTSSQKGIVRILIVKKKGEKNVEGKKERKKVVNHNRNFCVLRVKIIIPLC